MQPDHLRATTGPDRPRPRWLFRGRPGAWDVLVRSLADDPTKVVPWPIAPSGPSMADGDAVLLWRSGHGGGIAALCRVVEEPEARPRPGAAPEVVVGLRILRAFAHPIPPTTLLRDPLLRPLAFMDLHEETERRVGPAQEEALAALIEERERNGAAGLDDVDPTERVQVAVPAALLPVVEELLVALGADVRDGVTDDTATPPTAQQVSQAEDVGRALGARTFTVDDAATVWRTGVGTARSRIERLVDSGLLERAGTLRAEERPGVRPARGRPPVLYRLAHR